MATLNFKLLLVIALLSLHEATAKGGRGGGSRGGSHHSGSHSYPSSHGGLSGGGSHGTHSMSGGSHSYPSSGSSGGSHSYPSSGGLSGGGSHSYPSSGGMSGGSHSYPSSGGKPGGMSGGSHSYPSSGGMSGGSHSYPSSGGKTVINNHYHYTPPTQIRYTPVYGGAAVSYPVYHGTPPVYVYHYKDSGSVYSDLLAGLALYNLGKMSASSHSSSSNNYKAQPGEICKLGVKKDNGDYQETKIDCNLITSFIFEDQGAVNSGGVSGTNTTTVVTTVNVTMVNNTNGVPSAPAVAAGPVNVTYTMFPNGTLLPINVTAPNVTASSALNSTSSVTTTTTVTSALDVKGAPINVTPGMQCFIIRVTPVSNMRKTIPCAVLQSYTAQSLRRNSATKFAPTISLLSVLVTLLIFN